jgi:hypothetical protein
MFISYRYEITALICKWQYYVSVLDPKKNTYIKMDVYFRTDNNFQYTQDN